MSSAERAVKPWAALTFAERMTTLVGILCNRKYVTVGEAELAGAIESVLLDHGIPYQREHRLSPLDRVDFLVDGGIGLELKVDGTIVDVGRQLHRYAQSPDVRGIVLATRRMSHRFIPAHFNGKPVKVAHLPGWL